MVNPALQQWMDEQWSEHCAIHDYCCFYHRDNGCFHDYFCFYHNDN